MLLGFPGGLAGKESACRAGDLGSILGLGRSPGEGKGSPLQYSGLESSTDCIVHGVAKSQTRLSIQVQFRRVSLVAQLVKDLPAMQESLVRFFGREGPLEKGQATHSSVLGLPL